MIKIDSNRIYVQYMYVSRRLTRFFGPDPCKYLPPSVYPQHGGGSRRQLYTLTQIDYNDPNTLTLINTWRLAIKSILSECYIHVAWYISDVRVTELDLSKLFRRAPRSMDYSTTPSRLCYVNATLGSRSLLTIWEAHYQGSSTIKISIMAQQSTARTHKVSVDTVEFDIHETLHFLSNSFSLVVNFIVMTTSTTFTSCWRM